MRTLFIVHATSWCDNACVAKVGIQQLIAEGEFDEIIEVASSHAPAAEGRYLDHGSKVFTHEGISPVAFLQDRLFGANPLFPQSEDITLVGGVFNNTGGGCLNCAFDSLIRHQRNDGRCCTIRIPMAATYQAGEDGSWQDTLQVEQALKDLVWKLSIVGVPFAVAVNSQELISPTKLAPLVRLDITTAQIPDIGMSRTKA